MNIDRTRLPLPVSYYRLVRQFPLTRIRNAKHLEQAQTVLDGLLERDDDSGTLAYVDALTDLVESYEVVHEPIPDVSDVDVLKELMRANGLGQTDLARAVGIPQSTVSALLSGARSLTKKHMTTLAGYFRVSPSVFLPK
jgi:HTH-type transcriptional regulator/antitoxin HigA